MIIEKMEIISPAGSASAAPATPITPAPQNMILSPK
jgi:hypothetical protein